VPVSQGKYNNTDFGVNALLGIEFGRLFLTANYSQGLSEFYQTNNLTGSFRNKVMGATIGFYLSNERKRDAKSKDRDHDGVPDIEDDCPGKKGSALSKGCPDKDGDGVADQVDNYPEFAGSAKHNGCPAPDTDKDGINDDDDKCPNQKGVKENNGCPEINKEIKSSIESYAKRIQFKYKSAALSKKSKIVLDGIVKILKENPELQVLIEGYTSSDGNPRNHLRLSLERAESVKEYLVLNGIKAKRLKAAGFGDENPLNKNKTEAERAINRRVELKITNN
jgi:outer membrane protein OmpA-like peptidoglycan-associated protein